MLDPAGPCASPGPREALLALDSIALAPVHLDGRRDTVRVDAPVAGLPDWCTADPTSG